MTQAQIPAFPTRLVLDQKGRPIQKTLTRRADSQQFRQALPESLYSRGKSFSGSMRAEVLRKLAHFREISVDAEVRRKILILL
jgi:hypothetical protein